MFLSGRQGSDKIWTWEESTGSEQREHPPRDYEQASQLCLESPSNSESNCSCHRKAIGSQGVPTVKSGEKIEKGEILKRARVSVSEHLRAHLLPGQVGPFPPVVPLSASHAAAVVAIASTILLLHLYNHS